MNNTLNRALLIALPMLATLPSYSDAAVGRTGGTFNVAPTGAATYQIPLWVSPGAGGLQPNLTLTYDSQRGGGIVGPGWALTGLSAITRCNRSIAQDSLNGAVTLTGNDKYCMDGKRLRGGTGTYGWAGSTYETEIADFSQVSLPQVNGADPVYFIAKTKNALTYEFGRTTDSRITPAAAVTAPYMWLANKVSDRAGNTYKVTYGPGASGTVGTAVPLTIEYSPTTANGTTYINTVSFTYEAKATKFPATTDTGTRAYVAGNAVVNKNLLTEVKVSSNGSLVRRYVLDYELAPTTKRPRLTKVTECASLDLSDCLGPTVIGYQDGAAGLASTPITVASGSVGGTPLDMDGDGRSDVLYTEGGMFKVARGTPSGTFLAPINVAPVSNGLVGVADLTTKGSDDIVVRTGSTWTRHSWNGTAFTASAVVGITMPANLARTGLADVNGDGRLDALAVTQTFSARLYTYNIYVWLNWSPNKNTLTFAAPVNYPKTLSCGPSSATGPCGADLMTGTEFGTSSIGLDVNGDGKSDVIWRTLKPNLQLGDSIGNLKFLTFGTSSLTEIGGFPQFTEVYEMPTIGGLASLNDDQCTDLLMSAPSPAYSISPCRDGATSGMGAIAEAPLSTFDWNSDGRGDVLVKTGNNIGVRISTAAGLEPAVDSGIPAGSLSANNSFVLDFDGDGLQDLGVKSTTGTVVYRHAAPGTPPDLVTSITDGYGVNVSPVYGSILAGNYTKGTTAVYPERDLDTAMYVVKSVTSTTGASSANAPATYTQTFDYYEGRENLEGRGFEGFAKVRMSDGRNNFIRETYRHTDFPKTGLVYQDDLKQSDGKLISQTLTQYAVMAIDPTVNDQTHFPYVDWSSTETFEVSPDAGLNGKSIKKVTVDPTAYDSYGNATRTVTTATDTFQGSPTYGSSWTSTVTHTIAPNIANWCLNIPTTTIVENTAPGVDLIKRTTDFLPDYVRCRVDSETVEPNDTPLKVTTNYYYDGFGNVNQVTVTPAAGQAARTTFIDWGTTGRLTEKITNALSQVTTIEWNQALGVRTKLKDANLLETQFDIDSFGRVTREKRPDGTATDFALSACTSSNNYCDVPGSRSRLAITLRKPAPDNGAVRTDTEYFDLFDRSIRGKQQLLGSNFSEVSSTYDELGRLSTQSIPRDPATSPNNVSYLYDVVGRTIRIRRPTNAQLPNVLVETLFSYAGPDSSTTDALTHTTGVRRNPVGKVVKATDAAGKATAYTYDAFGNLLVVEDSKGNKTKLTYNALGMKTRSEDPDMGIWNYEYFPLGELKKQTDARNKVVELEYDALSRLTKRTEFEGETRWTWGTSGTVYNIGRLQKVEQFNTTGSSIYSETYAYDIKGRLNSRAIQSDSSYTYGYEYDTATGQLSKLTYPSAPGYQLALQYVYENALLREVKDSTTTYWRANAVNAFGQVTEELLGNNVTTTRTIDAVTGLVSRVTSGLNQSAALQNESYAYDDVGNVTQRQKYNRVGGNLNEDFHYDVLNRLETSIVTSPALGTFTNLTVRYDEIGNIIGRSDVANNVDWQYDPVRKHAVTQAGPTQYKYDENGNVKERNSFAIDWTSYNYPSVIRGPNKTLTFSYGPDRQRYRQVYDSGGILETTTYIGGALEKVNAGGVDDWRHYISAGGQSVAIVSRKSGVTTTRYLLNDHLGSIAAITDSSGAPILTESFDAFGARRDGEDWDSDCNCSTLSQIASITRHGFTGHEMIGGHSMGLIHMNGRVMDSVTGRFLSPDPFVQFPFDSQSFNRYSYVRNNPLSATDPSGFQEYDGDVRETPDWEPSICWMIGGCGWAPSWFPRPYVVIVHRPEPKIPPSRATPGPVAGPAVLSGSSVFGGASSGFGFNSDEGGRTAAQQFEDMLCQIGIVSCGSAQEPKVDDWANRTCVVEPYGFCDSVYGTWACDWDARCILIAMDKGIAERVYPETWVVGGELTAMAAMAKAAAAGTGRLVIGKLADLQKGVAAGERTLLGRMVNLGTPKANWYQNASLLRQEMSLGKPIRDASVDASGRLINNTGFLRAERNLMETRGWKYDESTRLWNPPVKP